MTADDEPTEEQGSRFYQGHIKRLLRGSETGIVCSATGRETPFIFRHVQMRGALRYFTDLREGMLVGFDVGWTSSGLRVTVLHAPEGAASERQAGAEEQVPPDQLADRCGEDGDVE